MTTSKLGQKKRLAFTAGLLSKTAESPHGRHRMVENSKRRLLKMRHTHPSQCTANKSSMTRVHLPEHDHAPKAACKGASPISTLLFDAAASTLRQLRSRRGTAITASTKKRRLR